MHNVAILSTAAKTLPNRIHGMNVQLGSLKMTDFLKREKKKKKGCISMY